MDNYNGFKAKQVGRQAQMFSNPWLTNRIQKMNTNAVTNGWTRLKLTPQEIQEARTMWNIPQVYSDDAVESIVNQNLIADNMGIRTVFYNSRFTPKWNINTENSALRSVVAPFNGQGAGIGGNQLLNSSKGGLRGDVTAILNNRVGINSFQDYVNSIKIDCREQTQIIIYLMILIGKQLRVLYLQKKVLSKLQNQLKN